MSTTAAMEMRMESQVASNAVSTETVLCLGSWYADAPFDHLQPLLAVLREALGDRAASTLIAYPVSDPEASSWHEDGLSLQPYQSLASIHTLTVQTSAAYLSLYEVMRAHDASCGMLLGAEAHSLSPIAIRGLLDAVLMEHADVALPRYSIGPHDGLINAAILHPLTRALFGVRNAFPMALDLALSTRAAERMAAAAQQQTATGQPDALLWPTVEAAAAGFSVAEVSSGVREIPHPTTADLATILGALTASLFTEIETKASYWQRTRPPVVMHSINDVPDVNAPAPSVSPEETSELIESFRIGYGNLHELWSLVLPPQTLLGLKHLSRLPAESFTMPDTLWVRIVYDFVLAHRLRTINRGHLLGALTPLYLAWVASHIQANSNVENPPEILARAFEADKPYLVSRWRWPDRFNP
ncbi:hypothetical protein [Terriglobus sp. TAA 43]|uniref:hypothetical protein n=1 Tax=Terriglobus sp. TAA 43 TaxID=278961 RepID=UPI000647B00B|nr:hypothetical protein [Terriglobus sp. TAA 43]